MTSPLQNLTRVHKALGHPARLRIVAMLKSGELCVCQLTAVLGLAPSTVSAHLAELRRVGLVQERKEGRWVYYSLSASDNSGDTLEPLWPTLSTDRAVRDDAAVLRKLRRVPVERLCRVALDLDRLSIARRPSVRTTR